MTRWRRATRRAGHMALFALALVVVHESGHTLLARLLGDPDSTFYLVQIGPGGRGLCLGCNITDHTRLSAAENFVVHLGGLLATQAVVLFSLIALRLAPAGRFARPPLATIALVFAFVDVTLQGIQGLLYNLERHTWPTGVDLMDAMLLLSEATGASQVWLKLILFALCATYLYSVRRVARDLRARRRAALDIPEL